MSYWDYSKLIIRQEKKIKTKMDRLSTTDKTQLTSRK